VAKRRRTRSELLDLPILKHGAEVIAAWALFLASADRDGGTTVTAPSLGLALRITAERAREIIDILCSPDSESRSTAPGGRRLRYRLAASRRVAAEAGHLEMIGVQQRRNDVTSKTADSREVLGQAIRETEAQVRASMGGDGGDEAA
jgi:hypothetical protein